jgi:hypothetical protein
MCPAADGSDAPPPVPCNPIWTDLVVPCTLRMELDVQGDPGVSALLVTAPNAGGAAQSRQLGADDFPLEEALKAGTTCVVMITVTSPGTPGLVTVTSQVSGGDSRGPDVCPLAVDADHPMAFSTTTAAGA